MKTWIVVPTFNESENVVAFVDALMMLPSEANVMIVDDNSPDGTGYLADGLAKKYSDRVEVIHRVGRRGLGTAYIEGFRAVLQRGAELIVQMDCDFSHSPDYVPRFIEKIDEYDVIVGSRYVPGGKTDEKWSLWRFVLSWWGNNYARWILGLQVRDSTAGFKLFRRHALESINVDNIRSNGYVFQVEVAYICEKTGMRILEWPIYFEDRRIGRSKMSVPVKLEAAWRVWQIRMRYGAMGRKKTLVEFKRDAV
jgi:dolichol-phosphate mannosyltransferase